MANITVHMGQYKTGSTAIQKFLHKHKGPLWDRGFVYPNTGIRTEAHFGLTDFIEGQPKRARDTYEALRTEVSQYRDKTVILSNEALSGYSCREFNEPWVRATWRMLSDTLGDRIARIVLYVRRQDDAVESRLIQHIKARSRGTDLDFSELVQARGALNYSYVDALLRDCFPNAELIYRPYGSAFFRGGSAVNDFLDVIGLTDMEDEKGERPNERPKGGFIEYLLMRNNGDLKDFLGRKNIRDDHTDIGRAWRYFNSDAFPDATVLTPAEREQIMAGFEDSNAAFAATCLSGKDRQNFEQMMQKPVSQKDKNVWMSARDLVGIFA